MQDTYTLDDLLGVVVSNTETGLYLEQAALLSIGSTKAELEEAAEVQGIMVSGMLQMLTELTGKDVVDVVALVAKHVALKSFCEG